MLKNLPTTADEIIQWDWADIEAQYKELADRPISADNITEWLVDWSAVGERIEEMYSRLAVATSVNTADKDAEDRMNHFLDAIFPNALAADQTLKEKLLARGLEPQGFEIPLRNMKAEAALYREANLPLLAEQQKLSMEFDKIYGAQTVNWDGEEVTLTRLAMNFIQPDRARREKAWRLKAERQLADRQPINDLWQKFFHLREKIARNADKPSFREYSWQQKLRFDYTPQDCKSFADAIEAVVVPAASRIYEKRKRALGLDTLRPWDLVDGWYSRPTSPAKVPVLKPFQGANELQATVSTIFHNVDPVLGDYFDEMVTSNLTDMENRKNKAPGAYCTTFTSIRKPFVFVNAVGIQDDVMTTLHESGHAFHVFETADIPYLQQLAVPMEFAEVASMAMELLASPYLLKERGGFYNESEAAFARVEHLEGMLLFWPFMAVVDSFQEWAYENPAMGANPDACDSKWSELWDRFIPAVDWSGLEDVKKTGWHRKLHIHQVPFYYVEYGLAQLGAVQIFGRAIQDQHQAVADYRKALSLGATVTLPELYQTAGVKFAFDAPTLKTAVNLMEKVVGELETKI